MWVGPAWRGETYATPSCAPSTHCPWGNPLWAPRSLKAQGKSPNPVTCSGSPQTQRNNRDRAFWGAEE